MATIPAQSHPKGIQKLINLLEHLNKPPKLTFATNVKTLRLTLAYKNDHWGARHFIQESLPRIRYANPDLNIEVVKWRKEKHDHWRPELELSFEDGKKQKLDIHEKVSSIILKELMTVAGGDPWKAHVQHAKRTGMPVVPGEELYEQETKGVSQSKKQVPNLEEFLKANPHKLQEKRQKERQTPEQVEASRTEQPATSTPSSTSQTSSVSTS